MENVYKNVYSIGDDINKKLRDAIGKEKYNELLKDVNKKFADNCDKDIVLSYHLNDAWEKRIATVDIYGNTAKCSYRDDKDEYILKDSVIKEIFGIVRKYSNYFQSEDYFIEDSDYIDGYLYRMTFFDGENLYFGVLANLILNFGREDCPNTNILVNFFNEIFYILEKSGVDKKYLRFAR